MKKRHSILTLTFICLFWIGVSPTVWGYEPIEAGDKIPPAALDSHPLTSQQVMTSTTYQLEPGEALLSSNTEAAMVTFSEKMTVEVVAPISTEVEADDEVVEADGAYVIYMPLVMGGIPTEANATPLLNFDSLVIEESYTSQPQTVATINGCDTFTLDIASGAIRFANEAISLTLEACDTLTLPEIFAAPTYDEGFIKITSEQQNKAERLRVATVEVGNIATLQDILGTDQTAAVFGKHFAFVDEDMLMESTEGIWLAMDINDENAQSRVVARGVCIRVPWGPGWVNWRFSNPRGAGYSVKPEDPNVKHLVWPQTPGQDLDGLYNSNWENCTSYKVTSNCTIDVHSNGYAEHCCHAGFWLAGYRPHWINPCLLDDWPNEPLR